jgi:2-iminobutanoate/2-iminopropanoate deaminase
MIPGEEKKNMPDSKSNSRREAMMAVALGLAGASSAQAADEWTPKKESAGGPLRSGHLLFIGGIGGWYPEKRPDGPGDVKQQTADCLTSMKASLEKAGSSMANVLKVQVSLVDPVNNWEPMTEVYNTFFPAPRPARNYFGTTGFRRPGQLLQIDCIAYVD